MSGKQITITSDVDVKVQVLLLKLKAGCHNYTACEHENFNYHL